MRIPTIFPALLLVSLAGCSGPESEEAVELLPGRYAVTVAGMDRAQLGGGPRTEEKSLCVVPDHARTFTEMPLRNIIPLGSGCSDKLDERKGNAFGGSRHCAMAFDGISMEFNLAYAGSLKADGFEIDGQGEMKGVDGTGAKQSGGGSFTVSGQRTGDC